MEKQSDTDPFGPPLQHGYPNPQQDASALLRCAYADLAELVHGQLMAQSHLKPLFDAIEYTWDEASQSLVGDLTQVAAQVTINFKADCPAFASNDSYWERVA